MEVMANVLAGINCVRQHSLRSSIALPVRRHGADRLQTAEIVLHSSCARGAPIPRESQIPRREREREGEKGGGRVCFRKGEDRACLLPRRRRFFFPPPVHDPLEYCRRCEQTGTQCSSAMALPDDCVDGGFLGLSLAVGVVVVRKGCDAVIFFKHNFPHSFFSLHCEKEEEF